MLLCDVVDVIAVIVDVICFHCCVHDWCWFYCLDLFVSDVLFGVCCLVFVVACLLFVVCCLLCVSDVLFACWFRFILFAVRCCFCCLLLFRCLLCAPVFVCYCS